MSVSASFFETLRARPLLGRTFAVDEDQPGATPTIVLSERLWRRRYASDPGVLGKEIVLNGRPHTVIGIMPGNVEFGPRAVEAWPILTLNPPTRRGPFVYRGIARLKPSVTVEQAASEMQAIAREVERAHPQGHTNLGYPLVPLHEVMVGRIRPLLWVLSGSVLLVLLIAVSNVANLMLARATARQRETAIRLDVWRVWASCWASSEPSPSPASSRKCSSASRLPTRPRSPAQHWFWVLSQLQRVSSLPCARLGSIQ